jgi:hypothetical protein
MLNDSVSLDARISEVTFLECHFVLLG